MKTALIFVALLFSAPAAAIAQTPAPAAGQGRGLLDQAGGLLGGAMPSASAIGAGNAAGLLGYCVKNKLLGATGTGAGAVGVRGRLTGQKAVTSSPDYAAGHAGQVQGLDGQILSLNARRGQVKTRLCTLVLSRARSFF